MRAIYNAKDYYMYEILEDYQAAATSEEQKEIFTSFCSLIWNNPNERKVTEKNITFHIRPELLSTETGQIFAPYTSISHLSCPSTTTDTDFASLVRQKVNNIYTNLFDADICTRKDYLYLLQTPRRLYYQLEASMLPSTISDPETFIPSDPAANVPSIQAEFSEAEPFHWPASPNELSHTLQAALTQAESLKETYGKQKMKVSWQDYQQIVEGFFQKLFDNYIPLDGYPNDSMHTLPSGTWHEDNFCISYFCNGLNGYFKNYQKKYYGLYSASSLRKVQYSRCACGNLFQQNKQRNRRLCDSCREQSRLEKYRRYNRKRMESPPKA